MRKIAVLICGTILLFNLTGNCQAALVASWNFTNTPATVGPMDSVDIWATIFNDPTSENMNSYECIGSNYQFNSDPYFPSLNDTNFTQLDHLELAPGESFDFLWGTATPVTPPVAPGTHEVIVWGELDFFKQNPLGPIETVNIRSDNGFNVNVVPIPGAIWLLASGLIGFVGLRRKFQK